MLSLVPEELFRAKRRCVLNPTFGRGSSLVGGADGDLIIDYTLIDIKTTKHLTFEREFFNQLIGYYVLSCIGGIDDCGRGKIKHVAIYYARYGADPLYPSFYAGFRSVPALRTSRRFSSFTVSSKVCTCPSG